MSMKPGNTKTRYHVSEKRLAQIYKEHPKQDRKKPYQVRQDQLESQLQPRLLWDSSRLGTATHRK